MTQFDHRSRQALFNVMLEELRSFANYKVAERVDSAKATLADILFTYRLFLGRWPEFDAVEHFRERRGRMTIGELFGSVIAAPEFQTRLPDNVGYDLEVMVELNDLRLFFNLRDRQSMRIAMGLHEPEIQNAMRVILRPGMNCIDIGSHVGLYSLLMASLVAPAGGKVYAFEPWPSTFRLLRKNIHENHFDDVILATPAACHFSRGRGKIFVPTSDDLGPAFVPRHADSGVTSGLTGLEIDLVRVDDVIPDDAPVGVVKLDIEGAEPFALRGMTRILAHDRPIIFTEFNPLCLRNMNESDPADYVRQIKDMGYSVCEITDYPHRLDREFVYSGSEITTNLICLPH